MGGRCFQKAALHRALRRVVQGGAQAAPYSPPSPGACRWPLPVLGASEGDIVMASVGGSVPFEGDRISRVQFREDQGDTGAPDGQREASPGPVQASVGCALAHVLASVPQKARSPEHLGIARQSHPCCLAADGDSWWKFHSLEPFPQGKVTWAPAATSGASSPGVSRTEERARAACFWILLSALGSGRLPCCVCVSSESTA